MDSEVPHLLSLLAHELRSPVGVIRGYLRMLDQLPPGLSNQQKSAVTAALRATDRAAELLAQASTLAQLRLGEITFDFRPIALSGIVAAAVAGVQPSEDPVVRVEVGDIPPISVEADEALLRSTLTRLIQVVIRAQAQATTLRVTGRRQSHDGLAGIALEMTAADPSQVSTHPVDISRGGVGLDLPIAASLLAAHRGQLNELRQGDGYAGVVVWLPVVG